MRPFLAAATLVLVSSALAGCPDRKELNEEVGGAAGRQVEQVRGKADAIEGKLENMANQADSIPTE